MFLFLVPENCETLWGSKYHTLFSFDRRRMEVLLLYLRIILMYLSVVLMYLSEHEENFSKRIGSKRMQFLLLYLSEQEGMFSKSFGRWRTEFLLLYMSDHERHFLKLWPYKNGVFTVVFVCAWGTFFEKF